MPKTSSLHQRDSLLLAQRTDPNQIVPQKIRQQDPQNKRKPNQRHQTAQIRKSQIKVEK